ncbi:MAG: class I SAM-dependent methyltransferase [Verrucomicrobiae bacterium]
MTWTELQRDLIRPYDEHAQDWADRLRAGKNWVHDNLEKPAIMKMAAFSGSEEVVCLGCGSGEEIRPIEATGARVILGIDLSTALLALARERNPGVTFIEGDIAAPPLRDAMCDVVFSSLAMHYAADWSVPLLAIRSALRPGGRFVFSTHHPVLWSAETRRTSQGTTLRHGYSRTAKQEVEVWGDYGCERWENDTWFDKMHVTFHHKTFATMIRAVVGAGFEIADISEPLAENDGSPDGAIYSRIPPFILFSLRKTAA